MKKWIFLCLCLCLYIMSVSSAIASYGRPNVALGGNVISNTTAILGSAIHINDGLYATSFYSYLYSSNLGGYYCEFVLDLTKSYSIDEINVYILQTRRFTIYVSDDNINWTLVNTREWAASVLNSGISIPFETPVTGRYIKYNGWASWNQYVGVSEIEVFETGSVPEISPPGTMGKKNIATGKEVVLNLYDSEINHPPENAIDSDLTSSWIAAGTYLDHETGTTTIYYGIITIDLGEEVNIGKVVLKTSAYHSNIISFPTQPADTWGEKSLFSSTPDWFVTNTTGSGEDVFEIKGLIKSRYLTLYTQTIQVTDATKPEIAEVEVYEWIDGETNKTSFWPMMLPAILNGGKR